MALSEPIVVVHGPQEQRERADDTFAENFMKWAAPEGDAQGQTHNNLKEPVAEHNETSADEPMQAHDPSPNKASNPGRSHEQETFTTGAEKSTVTDGIDVLLNAFANMGEARKVDKATVSELFDNGKPGQYLTRSRTLSEQVKGLLDK